MRHLWGNSWAGWLVWIVVYFWVVMAGVFWWYNVYQTEPLFKQMVCPPDEGCALVGSPPAYCSMRHPFDAWTGLSVYGLGFVNLRVCWGGGDN